MTTPFTFRPWGLLDWILDNSSSRQWNFVGCLGTELRSLAAWTRLKRRGLLCSSHLFRIADRVSHHTPISQARLSQRAKQFTSRGGSHDEILDHSLFEPYGLITEWVESFLAAPRPHVLLDVTSLPKRFFFPILKILLVAGQVEDLLVSYTVPQRYTPDPLAENVEDWADLPLFPGQPTTEPVNIMVVNVGFAPMGLQQKVEQWEQGLSIKLLFPFPAPPPAVRRSWGFVRNLMKYSSPDDFQLYFTDTYDVSDAFDRLVALTDQGSKRAILAPFGPKPISVAMCLFATVNDVGVYYTQPSIYHPDYSIGIRRAGRVPMIYTYWIRLDGRDLYSV